MKNVCVMMLGVAVSGALLAEPTVCKMGDMVRKIDVVHVDGDKTKPCTVQYSKETEMPGAPAADLWHYEVQVDQCEVKASELAEKLKGYGWSCEAAAAAPATM